MAIVEKNNKEDTMKRCYNCDTILEDDELFCHECGAKQEIEDVEVKPGTICRRKVLRSLWKSHRAR